MIVVFVCQFDSGKGVVKNFTTILVLKFTFSPSWCFFNIFDSSNSNIALTPHPFLKPLNLIPGSEGGHGTTASINIEGTKNFRSEVEDSHVVVNGSRAGPG